MAARARTPSRITASFRSPKPKRRPSESRAVASGSAPAGKLNAGASPDLPLILVEQVHRIEAMGKRIDGYIRFMCQIASQSGDSAEVKERAVTAFYEQMIIVERQLGHIHDELRLE